MNGAQGTRHLCPPRGDFPAVFAPLLIALAAALTPYAGKSSASIHVLNQNPENEQLEARTGPRVSAPYSFPANNVGAPSFNPVKATAVSP